MKLFTRLDATPKRGSAAFDYRGFVISVSNVYQPNEIAIWRGSTADMKGDFLPETFSATIEGIVAAKEFIDALA